VELLGGAVLSGGSLAITNVDALTVLNALPDNLPLDRHKAVETALQLVGKVNYFWGGKSYVIGWDSHWGQLMKVTFTGTFRPFGLDCTGFMDWTLRNAGLPSDGYWYIGTNLTEVTQAGAQPGDMALYPDASHIGMVVGRDSAGKLLICHCSSGANRGHLAGQEGGCPEGKNSHLHAAGQVVPQHQVEPFGVFPLKLPVSELRKL